MILTTTPTVEGYHISAYLETISGAAVYHVGGIVGEGTGSARQSAQFSYALQDALQFMLQKAPKDTDAIVGIQHSINSVSNHVIVTVFGTAVRLVQDASYLMGMEQARQQAIALQKQQEEEARRAEEESQRALAQKQQKQAQVNEELLAGTYTLDMSRAAREELIDVISYALNMAFLSQTRAKLKQANVDSGQEIIQTLLSLSDDELVPAAQNILEQLRSGA